MINNPGNCIFRNQWGILSNQLLSLVRAGHIETYYKERSPDEFFKSYIVRARVQEFEITWKAYDEFKQTTLTRKAGSDIETISYKQVQFKIDTFSFYKDYGDYICRLRGSEITGYDCYLLYNKSTKNLDQHNGIEYKTFTAKSINIWFRFFSELFKALNETHPGIYDNMLESYKVNMEV